MVARSGKDDPAGPTDNTVMSGHWMVRDGSVWMCAHCKTTAEFGGGMPDLTGVPCVPRRWGDGL